MTSFSFLMLKGVTFGILVTDLVMRLWTRDLILLPAINVDITHCEMMFCGFLDVMTDFVFKNDIFSDLIAFLSSVWFLGIYLRIKFRPSMSIALYQKWIITLKHIALLIFLLALTYLFPLVGFS